MRFNQLNQVNRRVRRSGGLSRVRSRSRQGSLASHSSAQAQRGQHRCLSPAVVSSELFVSSSQLLRQGCVSFLRCPEQSLTVASRRREGQRLGRGSPRRSWARSLGWFSGGCAPTTGSLAPGASGSGSSGADGATPGKYTACNPWGVIIVCGAGSHRGVTV